MSLVTSDKGSGHKFLDTIQNEEAKPFFYSLVEDDSKDDLNYEVIRSYDSCSGNTTISSSTINARVRSCIFQCGKDIVYD